MGRAAIAARQVRVSGDLTLGLAAWRDLGESCSAAGSGVPGLARFPAGLGLARFRALGH